MDIFSLKTKNLFQILNLDYPPFSQNPFHQLEYIEHYVKARGCISVAVEQHYIDRHYIEDHSIFYSKNLISFQNFCKRIHFFSFDPEELEERIDTILALGQKGEFEYRKACSDFSNQGYIGYSVIKPLAGCPIGRTVLIPPVDEKINGLDFSGTRLYISHYAGIELTVRGLAFQQQDVGVSACATTAIWSSLQKIRTFEGIKPSTPAQITMLAAQYTLPFGRPIPSEGLSLDQMCQATQSLGVSPNLFSVRRTFKNARSFLHSAIKSGYAPILIIESADKPNVLHAVTAVGMVIDNNAKIPSDSLTPTNLAGQLVGLYVHDDRHGSYIPVKIERNGGTLQTVLTVEIGNEKNSETWNLTHILIPMHSKIRLSFAGLREVTIRIVTDIAKNLVLNEFNNSPLIVPDLELSYEMKIVRATSYLDELIFGENNFDTTKLKNFCLDIPLSRYVGIIQLKSPQLGNFDVLVDTTSTKRNLNFLAILLRGNQQADSQPFTSWLAEKCKCPAIL